MPCLFGTCTRPRCAGVHKHVVSMADTMLAYSSGRSWLCAVALAVFDLDSGQKTEACVPEGELTTPELQAIAYGAFPVRISHDSLSVTVIQKYMQCGLCMQEARAYSSDAKNGICDRYIQTAPVPFRKHAMACIHHT